METGGEHRDTTGRDKGDWRRSQSLPGASAAGPLHNAPRMLRHLGRHLRWHARTIEVNDRLEQRLACHLNRSVWLRVRDLPLASVELPIPLMLFGPTGVFILQASRGHWIDQDIALMSRAANSLGAAIREYPDPVRPCIVILDGNTQERQHFTGTGEGPCWIVSDEQLLPWLLRFRDHGFAASDIARLRRLADPARIRETVRTIVPHGEGHSGSRPGDYYFPS
jgi:hypothetical protein